MKLTNCLVYLLVGGLSCSRPISVPVPSTLDVRYPVTALLNDSTWFGAAFAQREYPIEGKPCTVNRFALGLYTDLPHARSGVEPIKGVTGCVVPCQSTQHLGFLRIPLAVGRYSLSDLKSCTENNTQPAGSYCWLIGGDIIINPFYTRGTVLSRGKRRLIDIPGTDSSWIEVTKYDAKTNRVEGTFEITLIGRHNEIARFTKGVVKVILTQ